LRSVAVVLIGMELLLVKSRRLMGHGLAAHAGPILPLCRLLLRTTDVTNDQFLLGPPVEPEWFRVRPTCPEEVQAVDW